MCHALCRAQGIVCGVRCPGLGPRGGCYVEGSFNAVGIEKNCFTLELEGLQGTSPRVHFIDGEVEALRWGTMCPSPLSWARAHTDSAVRALPPLGPRGGGGLGTLWL